MRPKWIVKSVEPLDDYKLLLTFEYGEKKVYDMKPLLSYKVLNR